MDSSALIKLIEDDGWVLVRINGSHQQFRYRIKRGTVLARREIQNVAIKKTLTIPQWLNELAEREHINFSQILQSALKDALGITEDKVHRKSA